MSFILDALRKSEHERQRSTVPGLAQVPLATPPPQLPRWAVGVIVVLAGALLALGAAWWQSTRAAVEITAAPSPTVERNVDIPPPSFTRSTPPQAAPARPLAETTAPRDTGSRDTAPSLSTVAGPGSGIEPIAPAAEPLPQRVVALGNDTPPEELNLPSAAALAAQGVAVPPLRLELHAYSAQPRDRFVFINGRKYTEGERTVEGPVLVAIEPTGVVLTHAGRRFMLVQE